MKKLLGTHLPWVLPLAFLVIVVGVLGWQEGELGSGGAFFGLLENALIALMGEYPDKPATVTGRVMQLLLFLSGTVVLGAIVGKISSIFVTRALDKEKALKTYHDHVIICNWNQKAPGIIQQLRQATAGQLTDIVVVCTSEVEDQLTDVEGVPVTFVRADPTHHETLSQLQATKAKALILLADGDCTGPDEKNALIALAVKHLEQSPDRELDIHVVAELVHSEHRRHLYEAGVDEVVLSQDYSSGILAQSALFHNMSVVYQRLLNYSADTNEIYFVGPGNYPASFIGESFPDLCRRVTDFSASKASSPVLLLGVKRGDGQILLNPACENFTGLAASDSLIIMAFSPVDCITE